MHGQDIFIQAVIYLSAAVISVPIAKRLGFGSVLGYLLAGVIIGPFVLKLVGDEGDDVMHFAEFGVVLMLFLVGLELKPDLLWRMRRSIFGLGGLQVIISTVVIAALAMLFNQNILQSITIGLILALSSTAIILQTLSEKGQLKSEAGQGSFSVLLFQDMAVIPMLAVLPLMANQVQSVNLDHHAAVKDSLVAALPGWQQLLIILGAVAIIIIGGHYLARYVFRYIASTGLREMFTAFALLMVIGIAVGMSAVGLSPALGTFLAGVLLAESEYRHELETNIEPFKGLLLGLFFIAVGSSINFIILFERPGVIVALVGLLIAVKFVILLILGRVFKLRLGQGLTFAVSLAQSGEFGFLLISFSIQNSIITTEVSGILLIVVALSMLITPLLLIINEKLIQPAFSKHENVREADEIDDSENPVIIAGFGRFGFVLGRFLRANGIKATILDNSPKNIQVLRKFGFKVFYGDASRPDLLESAGAAQAKIIIIAVDDHEKINGMVELVKREYPHLKIFARSLDVRHSFELTNYGVAGLRRDTYDSSVALGVKTLHELGFKKYQAERSARAFKYHDEEVMEELHRHWKEDEKKYITEARKFSEQLESILLAEQEQSIHEADSAFDITSRREEIRKIYEQMRKEEEEE